MRGFSNIAIILLLVRDLVIRFLRICKVNIPNCAPKWAARKCPIIREQVVCRLTDIVTSIGCKRYKNSKDLKTKNHPQNADGFLMAPRVGLEPTTYRLTAGRSTIELSGNKLFF